MILKNLINLVNPSYHEDHLISFTYSFDPKKENIDYNSKTTGSLLTLGNNLTYLTSQTIPEFGLIETPSVVTFIIQRYVKFLNTRIQPEISVDNINSFVEFLTGERIEFNVILEQQDYFMIDFEISKLNKRIENR